MFNIKPSEKTYSFTYIGKPCQNLEQNGITIFHWGNIQNICQLTDLLNKETKNNLANISAVELIYYGYKHWGMGIMNHIQGDCAFMLYDENKDLTFLTRDSLGIAKIYYTIINNTCYFSDNIQDVSSELSSLNLQENLIQYYLSTGYTPPPYSLIEGIHKVPAASWVQIKNAQEKIKSHTYWYPLSSSYLIQESDIPSLKSAIQAVKNKIGKNTFAKNITITPKILFGALENQKTSSPIGDLYDFVSQSSNMEKEFFITKNDSSLWQRVLKIFNKQNKTTFLPATIKETEINKLISPFIKEKQLKISDEMAELYKDFNSLPAKKQTQSNWYRCVYLNYILPEKYSNFQPENKKQILNNNLIELMIGLPQKISLKVPYHIDNLVENYTKPPLEEWFFNRYKQQSYDLVMEFCKQTETLNIQQVEEIWQKQNLKINWRLTSLALFWQQHIEKQATFLM